MDWNILKKDKAPLALLIIISFVMFFYKLGAASLFETDEVIYSQVAREIIRTGDWITLHLFSKNWFIHPPFYMWLTACSSYIFGMSEFNTRFWNALFAVGLVYVTYLLGRKMFKDGVGLLAGFILATSLQYMLQSHFAIFDIPLVFFEMLALLFFFYWAEDRKPGYYYLFFLAMGLAVLMKGPIGILLPLLVIIPFLASTGALRDLFNLKLVPGLIIAYLFGGTWYTAETLIHGKAFTDSVFGFYMIGRYLTSIEQHYGPWYFYVPVLLVGFLPWISFLPFSITYQWSRKGDGDNLFSVMWMGIVFLFFTIAGTKLPGYVMPLYPIAAISVAKMMQDFFSGEDSGLEVLVARAYKTLAVYSTGLVVIAVLLRIFEFPDMYDKIIMNINVTLFIIGAAGIIASIMFFRERFSVKPLVVLVAAMVLVSLYTSSNTMITLDDFKPMKAISQQINSQYLGGEIIMGYDILNKGSFQYYLDKPVIWVKDIFELRKKVKTPDKFLLITTEKDFRSFGQEVNRSLFLVYKAGDLVLLSNKKL